MAKQILRSARVALCLLTVTALGATLQTARRSVQELSPASSEATIMGKAHRVLPLSEGSRLALHPEEGWEKGAIVADLFRPDGQQKRLRADMLVPSGIDNRYPRPPGQSVGQIYGASFYPDGDTLALSIGWADEKQKSHNAVAIVSLKRGQRNLIEFEGTVRDLAAGPGSSLLAVTYVPSRVSKEEGAPLLTLLDTRGDVHGEFFRLSPGADTRTIGDSVHNARLVRVDETRFALYRDLESTVTILKVSAPAKVLAQNPLPAMFLEKRQWPVMANYQRSDSNLEVERVIAVPDPEAKQLSGRPPPTLAFHVEKDGSVTVVRSSNLGRPHTTVRRYGAGGLESVAWSPATPWQAAYWAPEGLTGVTRQQETVVIESVVLDTRE